MTNKMLNTFAKNRFAMLCDWPHAKAAENETIKRFVRAASLVGKEVVVIDRDSKVINIDDSGHRGSFDVEHVLKNEDVDFVINLHFSFPRGYDGFSYVLLWNPLKFLHEWDYNIRIKNMVSNHDSISCGSSFADECFYRHSFCNGYKHLYPKIQLNHTNSGPYIDFHDNKSGVFYCGIGWDKNHINPKQRFQEIFEILDRGGILKIYGPQKLGNSRPWANFQSYKGEIPFDGVSLFNTISDSLLGLAISHPAHIETGIATSRVFELIAGGTLPICDDNTFIKDNFGDKVLYVEGNTEQEIASSIIKHYEWAINNKNIVKKMVDNLQNFMRSKYDLSVQIENLYNQHFERRLEIENLYFARSKKYHVNMIYFLNDPKDDLKSLVDSFNTQVYENKSLFIITALQSFDFSILEKSDIDYSICSVDAKIDYDQMGLKLNTIQDKLPKGENECYMIFANNCMMHYDHITSLVRIFEDNNTVELADFYSIRLYSGENFVSDDVKMISDNNTVSYKPFLFKKFPPFFILKSLNELYFTSVMLTFFENRKNTQKTTARFTEIKTKKEPNYNNISMFFDIVLFNEKVIEAGMRRPNINNNFSIDKKMLYKIFEKMPLLKMLMVIRKYVAFLHYTIRNIKYQIKCRLRKADE